MADRIFERVLNQSASGVQAQQEREDPEQRKRKAQARHLAACLPAASCRRLAVLCVPPLATLQTQHTHGMATTVCIYCRALLQASAEDALRKLSTGMTAGDAIKRILLAAKDKDYFRCRAGGASED